jgi:DnaJ-class molecular chaperone
MAEKWLVCPRCHGLGTIPGIDSMTGRKISNVLCPRCGGDGILSGRQRPLTELDKEHNHKRQELR